MNSPRDNPRRTTAHSPVLVMWLVLGLLAAAIGMPAVHAAHHATHHAAHHDRAHATGAVAHCGTHDGYDPHDDRPESPAESPIDGCVVCVKLVLAKHSLHLGQADAGLPVATPMAPTARIARSVPHACGRPRESVPRGPPTA